MKVKELSKTFRRILIRSKPRPPLQNANSNNWNEVLSFWAMDSYMEFLKEPDYC